MSDASPQYWAFLSYSSQDRPTARWVQRALETYLVPRRLVGRLTPAGPAPRRFRPIFRDGSDLAADPDLVATIFGALQKCAYLIVVCSPHAAKSHWVNDEVARFRELHGESRILAVILSGDPSGGDGNCFPPSLRMARLEPIAADLRPGGDGRRIARLKLVAGMLGVGLDELVRRDTQRRHRQMVVVTAASLAGVVVAAGLTTAALIARNDARTQRSYAEGLIEFMLTDLRAKLEPSGRLDALDGAGGQALKYYEAQDPAKLDVQSLARRARALRLMGEINVQRGNLGEALASFNQASFTTQELLERSPGDGQLIFNHAQNVFWVGEIARQRGDTAQAEKSFQEYRRLAEQLTTLDPHNDSWRSEVAYAESALGVLLIQEGRPVEATSAFERSLAVAESLAQGDPGDVNLQLELAQGHAWLADALERRGRLADAREHSETELEIHRAILTKDPSIRQARFATIDVLQTLGHLAMVAGDLEGARTKFKESADLAETMLSLDRDNMDITATAGIAEVALGESLLSSQQVGAAQDAQRRADTLLDRALAHGDSVALWHNYHDRSSLLQARIAANKRQWTDALRLDQGVLHRLDTQESPKANTETFLLLERSRLQSGEDLAALGRRDEANQQWDAVVGSLPGPLGDYEPRLLEVLAGAEQRLGRVAAAQAISDRLRDDLQPTAK